MNTSGQDTESLTEDRNSITPPLPFPNLRGLKIFVYIISILAGLAAGGIIAANSWSTSGGGVFDFPDIMGPTGLFAGIAGGIFAAWFWTKMMTRHVRNYISPLRHAIYGSLWGILAGWMASLLLWVCEGIILIGFVDTVHWDFISLCALIGIGIFGGVGGLGVGLICGIVWAIRTRPRE